MNMHKLKVLTKVQTEHIDKNKAKNKIGKTVLKNSYIFFCVYSAKSQRAHLYLLLCGEFGDALILFYWSFSFFGSFGEEND